MPRWSTPAAAREPPWVGDFISSGRSGEMVAFAERPRRAELKWIKRSRLFGCHPDVLARNLERTDPRRRSPQAAEGG